MPDGTSHAIWEVIKFPLVAVLGILGFNLKSLVGRVDKIEDQHITKEEFNKTTERFTRDMNRGFDNVRSDTQQIHKRMDQIIIKGKNDG